MKYDKCQRCELNYKLIENPLCDICARKEQSFDDEENICPFCEENILKSHQTMCNDCAKLL